jgi:flagellar biosynthesis protein
MCSVWEFAESVPMNDGFDDGFKAPGEDPLNPLNKKEKSARQTAVALKDRTADRAVPQITASGKGKIAEQILQMAYDNGIPVREDSALVEMLSVFDMDSPIPPEAFAAVAEILSYVYRANGQPNPFDAVLKDVMDGQQNKKKEG